jgi:hypothetical protein
MHPSSEMPDANLRVSHTAREDGGIDSAREGAFHDPAPFPQPAAMFSVALCDQKEYVRARKARLMCSAS